MVSNDTNCKTFNAKKSKEFIEIRKNNYYFL